MKRLNNEVKARLFSSVGTAAIIPDYKNGKEINVLSQGEKWYYYYLRWNDDVDEIYTQIPLDSNIVNKIASKLNLKSPVTKGHKVTSDILVIKKDGNEEIYSVKDGRQILENERTVEKLIIEKIYWNIKNCKWHLVFKEDLNRTLINNLINICSYYKVDNCSDVLHFTKYLIANKIIHTDLETKPIIIREIYLKDKERIDILYGNWCNTKTK